MTDKLTPEEIKIIASKFKSGSWEYWIDDAIESGAKAQLKNVRDWGEGGCEHNPPVPHSIVFRHGLKRYQCPECWQALLKEIE